MRNIQNIDITLQDIVKNIKNNNYLIPKFQRDFVWNTGDISDLGDSIIRGYPISSLLTMPENGTLTVGSSNLVKDDFYTICSISPDLAKADKNANNAPTELQMVAEQNAEYQK